MPGAKRINKCFFTAFLVLDSPRRQGHLALVVSLSHYAARYAARYAPNIPPELSVKNPQVFYDKYNACSYPTIQSYRHQDYLLVGKNTKRF